MKVKRLKPRKKKQNFYVRLSHKNLRNTCLDYEQLKLRCSFQSNYTDPPDINDNEINQFLSQDEVKTALKNIKKTNKIASEDKLA